jgi:hypothetical protein
MAQQGILSWNSWSIIHRLPKPSCVCFSGRSTHEVQDIEAGGDKVRWQDTYIQRYSRGHQVFGRLYQERYEATILDPQGVNYVQLVVAGSDRNGS